MVAERSVERREAYAVAVARTKAVAIACLQVLAIQITGRSIPAACTILTLTRKCSLEDATCQELLVNEDLMDKKTCIVFRKTI